MFIVVAGSSVGLDRASLKGGDGLIIAHPDSISKGIERFQGFSAKLANEEGTIASIKSAGSRYHNVNIGLVVHPNIERADSVLIGEAVENTPLFVNNPVVAVPLELFQNRATHERLDYHCSVVEKEAVSRFPGKNAYLKAVSRVNSAFEKPEL